VSRDFEVGSN